MKNLKNWSLKRLNNLPTRQNFKQNLNSSLQFMASDRGEKYDNGRDNLRLASRILEGSVGKKFSDVKKKILPLVKNFSYDWFKSHIEPVAKDGFVGDRRGYEGGYYIDWNGILRYKPYPRYRYKNVKVRNKTSSDWRNHYNSIKRRAIERKNTIRRIDESSLGILKMINRPELFHFYTSLRREKDKLEKNIFSNQTFLDKHYPIGTVRRNKSAYFWRQWYAKDIVRDKQKLLPINDKLRMLEQGEYNIFYHSNTYLYSLQKECHHFDQP